MAGKFSEVLAGQLVDRFRAGATIDDACRDCDVRPQTVKNWLSSGRSDPGGVHGAFAAAVDAARAEAERAEPPMDEVELARVVSRAARKGSVQAMKLRDDMLERERRREEPDAPVKADPLAFVDELASRRAAVGA